MPQAIILLTPVSTREYGTPEAIGPFADQATAEDHLEGGYITVGNDWEAQVIELDDPNV